MDLALFCRSVAEMTERGPDAYKQQAAPLCRPLIDKKLYVGRRFASVAEVQLMPWSRIYNVQARSKKPQDTWYWDKVVELKCYTCTPIENTDKLMMEIVNDIVQHMTAIEPPCVFIHDNEDGAGPAAIIAAMVWLLVAKDPELDVIGDGPVPEAPENQKQLRKLVKAAGETLESAWLRATPVQK